MFAVSARLDNFTRTKSQHHRMSKVGRPLWWSSGPTSLLKLEPVVQDLIQMALEYLQGWRIHNLPGWPVQAPGHSHSKKKKVSWCSEGIPVLSLCPLFQVLSLGTTYSQFNCKLFVNKCISSVTESSVACWSLLFSFAAPEQYWLNTAFSFHLWYTQA